MDQRLLDAFRHGETIAWPTGTEVTLAFADPELWQRAERGTLALLS